MIKLEDIIPSELFVNKEKRYKLNLVIVSVVFFIVGTIFTVVNIIKSEYTLGVVTGSFAILSLIVAISSLLTKKKHFILELIFIAAALILFTYFLIDGGAGSIGFSTYWILLLPFLSMLVFGLVKGLICGLIMLAIIIICLALPNNIGTPGWNPDDVFRLRFPLVYGAALVSSALFELSRFYSDIACDRINVKLQNAASHDVLTGLTNRYGLTSIIEEQKKLIGTPAFKTCTVMLIDIDNFKSANDLYGHKFGDEVLVSLANILRNKCGEDAIRFGGDEFILLFSNKTDFETRKIAEDVLSEASQVRFEDHPEYTYTISVGVATSNVDENYRLESIIELADNQASSAKNNGKNTIYSINLATYKNEGKTKKTLMDILKRH